MQTGSSLLTILLTLSLAVTASAQAPAPAPARGPFAVGFSSGLVAGDGDTGSSLGATLAAEVAPRVAVEARAVYLARGRGADALDLHASLLVDLLHSRRAIPYASLGGGIYHAQFDLDTDRFMGGMRQDLAPGTSVVPLPGGLWGMMQPQGPRSGVGPGWATGNFNWAGGAFTGATFQGNQMPAFYANRMGEMRLGADGRFGRRSFTDPSLSVGGGVRVNVTNRLVVKPDVRALVIFGGGQAQVLTVATVGLGLRF